MFLFSNFFFSSNLHDHIYTASVILLVSISTVILLAQIYYEKSHGGVLLAKIHCDTAALFLLVNAKTRSDLGRVKIISIAITFSPMFCSE